MSFHNWFRQGRFGSGGEEEEEKRESVGEPALLSTMSSFDEIRRRPGGWCLPSAGSERKETTNVTG